MRVNKLRKIWLAAHKAGSRELRGSGIQRERENSEGLAVGEGPPLVSGKTINFPGTHGKQVFGEPCGKCGGKFVNVICPTHWPIEVVALGCSMCGSIIQYVDNLLLLEVK